MVPLSVCGDMGKDAVESVDVPSPSFFIGVEKHDLAGRRLRRRKDVEIKLVIAVTSSICLLPGPYFNLYATGHLAVDGFDTITEMHIDTLDIGVEVIGAVGGLFGLELDVCHVDGRRDIHDRVDTLAHAAVGGVAIYRREVREKALNDRIGVQH